MLKKVLIYGSCVTRDIFNLEGASGFKIIDYYARSSIASLTSAPYENDRALSRIASDFRRRMVARDFSNQLLTEVEKIESTDCILLDFIDERFDLVILTTGEVITHSAELAESGLLQSKDVEGFRLIKPGSSERRELWLQGAGKFFALLKSLNKLDRVVVNKVYWSAQYAEQTDAKFPATAETVDRANQELSWMYEALSTWLEEEQFLKFASSLFVSDAAHRWGPSPFHYCESYYSEALEQLINRQIQPQQACITSSKPKLSIYAQDNRNTEPPHPATQRASAYDVSAWKMLVYRYDSLEAALASRQSKNAIYQVALTVHQTLDLCVQGLQHFDGRERRLFLVGLSGAIAERNGKHAPFFSGLGIAKSLKLPIISVSDPSLALNDQLSLAWYAGNESVPDLPSSLARLLDHFAKQYDAQLLVFGGSGGGFATLQLGAHLNTDATLLAWNPQTSICDYVPHFVQQYIDAAFPSSPALEKELTAYCRLQEAGVNHDLRNTPVKDNIKLLYLQNQSDWHTEKHTQPYLANKKLRQTGKVSFEEASGRCVVHFGHWGEGHIPPPKEMLLDIINKFADNQSLTSVACDIEATTYPGCSPVAFTHLFSASAAVELTVTAHTTEQKVSAFCSLTVDGQACHNVTFAFYLLVDGKRQDMRWYEASAEAHFARPKQEGMLEIMAFAKDILGERVISKLHVQQLSS